MVKLLDFGLVKELEVDKSVELTAENSVLGTPQYMAPECLLAPGSVDGRADIYATGCVAYWLLTGQYVFAADSAMDLLLHHARTRPMAPSTRTGLPIPAGLDDLVLSCLAKEPAGRPQSARELSARLAAIETSEWSQERARAWWGEHRPQEPVTREQG